LENRRAPLDHVQQGYVGIEFAGKTESRRQRRFGQA